MNHEVFEGHFGLQIMPRGNDIFLRGFCDADWVGDANDRRIHHGVLIFCWHWSHFMEMQETTNHRSIYDAGGVHDYSSLY